MLTARLYDILPDRIRAAAAWGWVFDACLVLIVMSVYRLQLYTQDGFAFGDFLFTGPFCLAILSACCSASTSGHPQSGFMGRLLATSPLVWLADCAFAAYLVQDALLHTMPLSKHLRSAPDALAHAALSFGIGALVHPVEAACARWVDRRIRAA
mmetsp:Transcript_105610/g.340370  ORF Transcript_105610/g.340370 Transcript_105610/m.340370 type:complete len:154 (-) Transcript_105610:196-657(-)